MHDLSLLMPGKLKVLMDISNKCNLRCKMCHFSFDRVFMRPADYMSPDEFTRVANEVFPYAHTVVLSAGSEPTLSPHFEEILRIASVWPLQELKFLTNGILFTTGMTTAILESSVTQIDVSIDGACAATYEKIRRGGRFDRLVSNLKRLRDMKKDLGKTTPLVQFNVTLMKSNLAELSEFVDLAEQCGVQRIGCRHLMPYEGLDMAGESLFDIKAEANEGFQKLIKRIERSPSVQLITFPDFFALPDQAQYIRAQTSSDALAWRLNNGAVQFGGEMAATPLGYVDLPAPQPEVVSDMLHFAGWALDSQAIECVALASRHGATGEWRIHELAKRVNGSRPDVAERFGQYPDSSGAGWVCDLDIHGLPDAAQQSVELQVIAVNQRGIAAVLGTRRVRAPAASERADHSGTPFLFCQKPFNSIYIESSGDVYPYPDCRPDKPSGNLLNGTESFVNIWNGVEQQALRDAIVQQRPPAMCQTCPNFINRKTDDAAFFVERKVEEGYTEIPLRAKGRLAELLD